MKMIIPILFTLILAAHARPRFMENPIRLKSNDYVGISSYNCVSWRWAVETNNSRDGSLVPEECISYVAHYIDGKAVVGKDSQYEIDIRTVVQYAVTYLTTLNPAKNGKDIWVFDIDETLLSNAPYYRRPDVNYGGIPYNDTKFDEWITKGDVPGIDDVVSLYHDVQKKGFKTVILTGTSEKFREVREESLRNIGVYGWEKLILRTEADKNGKTSLEYKSEKKAELVKEGYKIVGNIGDQWSDISGPYAGERTFKVPNPMYYLP